MAATTNPHIQLEIGADTSQAVNALQGLGAQANRTAQGVNQAGKDLVDGWEKVAPAVNRAAKSVEKDAQKMAEAVRRGSAEIALGGKQSAEYLEFVARQKGIADQAIVKSEIDRRRQVQEFARQQAEVEQQASIQRRIAASAEVQRLRELARGYDSVGNTAKQTTAALRQVPAQFTDIFVSLQGGQNPMTVLLQQGGQLKDVFGGIVPAAKALGGYIAGLVNPFTVAAAGAVTLAAAYEAGAGEARAFSNTLINTGNQAGATVGQLQAMAQAIDQVSGTQGNAADVLNQLAATGKVSATNLQAAALAAIQFERAGGQAAEETVKAFAELGKAPLEASLKLNETMGYLTKSTYEQVRALESQGRMAEAATVAQNAFADALNGRTGEMVNNLGYLQRGWQGVSSAVAEAWDYIKGIGRETGADAQLAAINAQVAGLEKVIAQRKAAKDDVSYLEPELKALKERQSIYQSDAQLLKTAASAQADQVKLIQEGAKWDKEQLKYADNKTKAEREINLVIAEGTRLKRSQSEIDARVNEIRERYKDKPKSKTKADNSAAKELAEEEAVLARLSGVNKDYQEQLTRLQSIRDKYNLSEAYYVELVEELIKKQPGASKAIKDQENALKAHAEASKNAQKATAQYYDGLEKELSAIEKSVDALRLQGEEIGLTAEGLLRLTLARQDSAIATEQERKSMASLHEASAEDLALMQRRIDLLKEQRTLTAANGQRTAEAEYAKTVADASKKEADAAAAEWKRASDEIEKSLTDALMRGFESGKGFAEVLRDTVENMFKTLVLRPVIQATVQGGLNSVGLGGLGAGGKDALSLGGLTNSFATSQVGASLGLSRAGATTVNEFGQIVAGPNQLTTAGANIGTALNTAATVASFVAAINTAYTRDSKGGKDYGIAIGQGIGTLLGGPLGGAIGGVFGSMLGIKDYGGTAHSGGTAQFSAGQGLRTSSNGSDFGIAFDVSQGEAGTLLAAQVATVVASALEASAAAFGTKAGYTITAAFADDISPDGAWGQLQIQLGERVLAMVDNAEARWPGREFADGEEGVKQYLEAVGQEVRNLLIDQSPQWADTMLSALGESPSIEQVAGVVAQITAAAEVFDAMGRASASFASLSEASIDSLNQVLGGAQATAQALGGYYANFYTEAERTANATAKLGEQFALLGKPMPATREAFRGLVEGAQAAGDVQLLAGLYKLQSGFADIVPWVEKTGEVIEKTSDVISKTAQDIAASLASLQNEGKSLQRQLLEAQGGDLRAFDTAGFTEAETAAYDFNSALRAQIKALNDSKTAAQAAADAQIAAAASQKTFAEKYTAPIDDKKAGELLGTDVLARIAGKSSAEIREMARVYVTSLDAQTAAGRSAIEQFEELAPAIDYFADAADKSVQKIEELASKIETAISAVQSAQNVVDGVRGEATSAYLSALNEVESAQQRITDIQLSAQQELAQAANQTASEMADIGKSLREFVSGANLKPSDNFSRLLAAALGGDKAAMQALPGAATAAIDTAKTNSSSGLDFARRQADILSKVSSVAGIAELAGKKTETVPSGVDPLTKANADLVIAQSKLTDALFVANTINAPSTASVTDLIAKFNDAQKELTTAKADLVKQQEALEAIKTNTLDTANNTEKIQFEFDANELKAKLALETEIIATITAGQLPDSLKALALDTVGSLSKTVDVFIKSDELPLTLKQLALGTADAATVTLKTLITDSGLTQNLKELGLGQINAVSKTIETIVTNPNGVPNDVRAILFASAKDLTKAITLSTSFASALSPYDIAALQEKGGNVFKIIQASLSTGTLSADDRLYLEEQGGSLQKFIDVQASGSLTADQRAVLDAVTGTTAISATVSLENRLAADGGLLAYSKADVAAAYAHGGRTLAGWLAYMSWQLDVQIRETALARGYVEGISSGYYVPTVRSQNRNGTALMHFAQGGAFTNSIVSSPTTFSMGLMGEAGPEAIMPLSRAANGDLGVQVQMPDWSQYGRGDNNTALIAEIRALREDNQAQARALVGLQQRLVKLNERWDAQGLPETRIEA